jgi:CheY-like chemotaxis protein
MATPPRILVVDDNEVVLDILREFLSPAYTVNTATSASIALDTMRKTTPDAILLDVKMPGMDGLTLLSSLRARGVTVPIFVITGYDSMATAQEALHSGANGYLAKPFDLKRLDRLLADALGVLPMLD